MKKFFKYLLRTVLIIFLLLNIVVAFHAYKFTHFYNNGELGLHKSNKSKPSIKELLFGFNAEKQKNAAPDSGYQTVILKTKDGIKLEGWYIPVDSAKGTVCLFHGHGGTKTGINAPAEAFRKMGYNTFQLDFRAHGSSGGNTCTIGYEESEDVKLAYDFVKNQGEKNIILWGVSLGAATITKAMADYQSIQPNKVILEMPFGTIEDAVKGRMRMMGVPAQPISTLLTFWGGAEHGFWAFNMQPVEYAKQINCPVLLQWGKNDTRVSKEEEDELFANLASPDKKFVVYEECGHENICIKENTKWLTEIKAFLQ
jgi:hypothetical protein